MKKNVLFYAALFGNLTLAACHSKPSGPDSAEQQSCRRTGTLIIGHEVRSFRPENDSLDYWIIDKTGRLSQEYDQITGGIKNGIPIQAELEVIDVGKSDEGFAAEYDGTYHVTKIIRLQKMTD